MVTAVNAGMSPTSSSAEGPTELQALTFIGRSTGPRGKARRVVLRARTTRAGRPQALVVRSLVAATEAVPRRQLVRQLRLPTAKLVAGIVSESKGKDFTPDGRVCPMDALR